RHDGGAEAVGCSSPLQRTQRTQKIVSSVSSVGESEMESTMKKLLTFLFLALAAIPLHAAEEAPLSPFAGDLGNAVWTLGIFLIVVIVLGKFAWGPVLSLLQEREQFIHKSLSDAKHDRDEAEQRLKDYAAKLQSAQVE